MLNWDTPKEWDKWNAKLVNRTTDHAHVEVRTTRNDQDVLVIVSLTGNIKLQFGSKATERCNVRISSNLPIKLSFQEWQEFIKMVEEATEKLEILKGESNEQVQSS